MKAFKNISLFSMLLSMVSCSQFLTHRDYLAEMEHDDSSFYRPDDFPVVAGDSGEMYESADSRRARTPASARDVERDANQRFLHAELKSLEGKLSEESRETYDQHKHRMNISERIYYLKLTNYERRDYLQSRGYVADRKPASSEQEEMFVQRQSNVILGMSKADVVNNWGKPSRVEVAGNPSFENERWLYNVNGASKYIYFESGRVGGWE